MAKRDLFNELMEGFDALKKEREGKVTLRTSEIAVPRPIEMSPGTIARIREEHRYSQGVFARMLCTNVSTLRNWEQGRSEPNAQAKVLLKMVETAPDVLAVLARVANGTVTEKAKAKRKSSMTAGKKVAAKVVKKAGMKKVTERR